MKRRTSWLHLAIVIICAIGCYLGYYISGFDPIVLVPAVALTVGALLISIILYHGNRID